MTILAIDPGRSYKGERTIGYCLFTDKGEEIHRGVMSFEELVLELSSDRLGVVFDGFDIRTIVIEDFINNSQSKGGQRNGTSECIGAVEYVAIRGRRNLVRQRPDTLGPAKLHAGYEQKLQHLPHQDSAYLHGYEYFVRQGILKPKGLESTMSTDHQNGSTT